jgi:hypothetical protein
VAKALTAEDARTAADGAEKNGQDGKKCVEFLYSQGVKKPASAGSRDAVRAQTEDFAHMSVRATRDGLASLKMAWLQGSERIRNSSHLSPE